jgi:hypothetical protein
VPVAAAHGGERAVRPAVQFDGARWREVTTAPLLNEHGAAVRKLLAAGAQWPELME